MTAEEPFAIQKHHLDTHHHVNNCQYIRMAADYLPEGFVIRQMRAEYKKQALLGDIFYPSVKQETGKVTRRPFHRRRRTLRCGRIYRSLISIYCQLYCQAEKNFAARLKHNRNRPLAILQPIMKQYRKYTKYKWKYVCTSDIV